MSVFPATAPEAPFLVALNLTQRCNLQCAHCYLDAGTRRDGDAVELSTAEVKSVIDDIATLSNETMVVLTGGEPMLLPDLVPLAQRCRELGKRITIETAGTIDQPVICDLMAISPKLSNSVPDDPVWHDRHENARFRPDLIRSLLARYECILKFVIDQPQDVDEVRDWLSNFRQIDPGIVWLMPQARTREELAERSVWLQKLATKHGFRFSYRLHIELFGDARGK